MEKPTRVDWRAHVVERMPASSLGLTEGGFPGHYLNSEPSSATYQLRHLGK